MNWLDLLNNLLWLFREIDRRLAKNNQQGVIQATIGAFKEFNGEDEERKAWIEFERQMGSTNAGDSSRRMRPSSKVER